ncbi:multidrug transporter subunit MdtN [Camelimonas abortus]|uniref:Multidrug transporter subunit MdtN n=1 Tax=Camelimonas abortus TaxID=1017184 RepID=A0ABV7LC94_9HYPH
MDDVSRRRQGRFFGVVASVIIIAVAAVMVWRFVQRAGHNPLSQEATLSAESIPVSASVAGRIAVMNVSANQAVKKGDLLFALDPEPYRLARDQAAADLRMAEAALADRRRAVAAEQSNAVIAGEQIARARNNLALATQTLARLEALRPKGYVSAQEVDSARTVKQDAEVSLRQAERQKEAADALVGGLAAAEALVEARRAALALAERALANTEVRAPFDGKVSALTAGVGEYVLPGQSAFMLINTAAWYAVAPFVETELSAISVGACATVYALADRTVPIRGVVESISWGVASESVINIPRSLPVSPKSLDWVRIAQRFPVRIRLIDPPDRLMRVGASATATVHHGQRC